MAQVDGRLGNSIDLNTCSDGFVVTNVPDVQVSHIRNRARPDGDILVVNMSGTGKPVGSKVLRSRR